MRHAPAFALIWGVACGPGPADDRSDDVEVEPSDTAAVHDDTAQPDPPLVDPCFGEEAWLAVTTVVQPDGLAVLVDGQDLVMKRGVAGGWLLPLGVTVSYMRQLAKIQIRVVDAVTGDALTVADPFAHNTTLTPPGWPPGSWECVGGVAGLSVRLNAGLAYDGTSPGEPWRYFCGRQVHVEASVTDDLDLRTVAATYAMTLQPDPEDGEPCRP